MERCPSCQNLIFKEESYWQLLMGVMGNVRSGWGNFHSKNQLPRSVQRGGVIPKKKKKKVQHAKKTKIPESSGKDRTLKKEDKGP